jgi:glucosamine kinase
MASQFSYLLAIDGGGTGTRALLANADGVVLGRGSAGASTLARGSEQAWAAIELALANACADAGIALPNPNDIAVGCGMAGAVNPVWVAQFVEANLGYGALIVETDGHTSVLGAHSGAAGGMIALGTGSVAEVLYADGSRKEVGGWGFPVGDEASGAWLGWKAIGHALRTLDGRAQTDAFSAEVLAYCGGTGAATLNWLAGATPTRFAELAPLVVRHAMQSEGVARELMRDAGREVLLMADALNAERTLPIALCGGLAQAIAQFLPDAERSRFVQPLGESVDGALILLKRFLQI